MTQIKLSIALVLAAAVIAPVVAQPIREGDDFASNVVHHDLPHHHHHHHGHHHHHQSATPVEHSLLESTSRHDTIPPLSPREYYAEEFEVRGLFDDSEPEIATREFDDLFERQESEGAESSADTLPHSLRFGRRPNGGAFTPHRVRLGRPFRGISPRLGHGLGGPFNGFPHRGFGHGPVMLRHGPARRRIGPREFNESEEMFERNFDDSETEIATREFDDLFERQESGGAVSSPRTSRGLSRFGPGSIPLGHGPAVHRPFKGLPPLLGLSLHIPRLGSGSGFGLGPVNLRQGRPARRAIGPREFTESEEMLERDFEDIEDFDARELDDDLYLD